MTKEYKTSRNSNETLWTFNIRHTFVAANKREKSKHLAKAYETREFSLKPTS